MSDLIIDDSTINDLSEIETSFSDHTTEKTAINENEENHIFEIPEDDENHYKQRPQTSKSSDSILSSKQLFDSLGDGVLLLDLEGKVISFNKTAESLTGWKEQDLLGKVLEHSFTLIDKNFGHDDIFGFNNVDRLVKSLNFSKLVSKHVHGGVFKSNASLIKDERGEPVKILIIFKKIEEDNNQKIEDLYKFKHENFITITKGILHDINNYFTPVLGNLSLLKMNTDTNDKNYDWIKSCESSCIKAVGFLKRLELISESGRMKKELVPIAEIVKSAVDLYVSGTNIKYNCVFGESLKPVELDKNQFIRAIYNTIKAFSKTIQSSGTINLIVENFKNEEDIIANLDEGEYIKILIENDNSIDCAEEREISLMDLDSDETNALGLTISYNIVKDHGGLLDLQTYDEGGMKAKIYIPALNEEVLFLESEDIEFKDDDNNDYKIDDTTKVLLMDDNEFVRESVGEMISQLGVDFEIANDSDEAIRMYSKASNTERNFNVAILDLKMPGGMGAHDLVKVIKAIDKNVKTIVTTGTPDHPIMKSFRKYGFDGFINKPFEISELKSVLSSVLE